MIIKHGLLLYLDFLVLMVQVVSKNIPLFIVCLVILVLWKSNSILLIIVPYISHALPNTSLLQLVFLFSSSWGRIEPFYSHYTFSFFATQFFALHIDYFGKK